MRHGGKRARDGVCVCVCVWGGGGGLAIRKEGKREGGMDSGCGMVEKESEG